MEFKFSYSGKDKADLIKIKYLHRVLKDATMLVEEANKLKDETIMKDWFGKRNFEKIDGKTKVIEGCGHIMNFLKKTTIECISRSTNSMAFTDKISLKKNNPLYGRLQINLGLWFKRNYYCHGERVVAILHEISHVTPNLATSDCKIYSQDAYKEKCIQLANSDSTYGKALKNAENWAYYIAAYHKQAGLSTLDKYSSDWIYVAKNQLSKGRDKKTTENDMVVVDQSQKWIGFVPYEKYSKWPGYVTIDDKKIKGWQGKNDQTIMVPAPRRL